MTTEDLKKVTLMLVELDELQKTPEYQKQQKECFLNFLLTGQSKIKTIINEKY